MALSVRLSNLDLAVPNTGRTQQARSPSIQEPTTRKKRLSSTLRSQVVADYQAGTTVAELAASYVLRLTSPRNIHLEMN